MVFECCAIVIIILIMCFMVLRTGRSRTAIMLLPLVIVPFTYIISGPIASFIATLLIVNPVKIKIIINILALVIATLLFSGLSPNIKTKVPRYAYWAFCLVFTVILELVLLFNSNLFALTL